MASARTPRRFNFSRMRAVAASKSVGPARTTSAFTKTVVWFSKSVILLSDLAVTMAEKRQRLTEPTRLDKANQVIREEIPGPIMAATKPMTISLSADLLRETQRVATVEATTPAKLVEVALRQYLTSHRWQRLRQWGSDTAKRLELKSEADLERFLRRGRSHSRSKRR